MDEKALKSVEFLWNENTCSLQISDGCINLSCIDQYASNLCAAADISVNLLNVVSSSYISENEGFDVATQRRINENRLWCLNTQPIFSSSLLINYWKKSKKNRRKLEVMILKTNNKEGCHGWHRLIESRLGEVLEAHGCVRPRKLLVIINPYCGKKKAKSIHKKIVSPLFQLAGVEEEVFVTEYPDHAREYVECKDLTGYDGIVVVGGDGTFNEVANGVLISAQRKENVTMDGQSCLKSPINYVKASIKLGHIPAGSANGVACTSLGTTDIETASLQIICGESHPLDVLSASDNEGNFVRFYFIFAAYGIFGSSTMLSERLRVLGPTRYKITNCITILKSKFFPCEISYLPSSPSDPFDVGADQSRCRSPCAICMRETIQKEDEVTSSESSNTSTSHRSDSSAAKLEFFHPIKDFEKDNIIESKPYVLNAKTLEESLNHDCIMGESSKKRDDSSDDWKVTRGKYFLVHLYPHANKYDIYKDGLSPSSHLCDGTADLIIGTATSRTGMLQYLRTLTGTNDHYDFPFIEAHRVKGFRLKPLSKNCLKKNNNHPRFRKLGSTSESLLTDKQENSSEEKPVQGFWANDAEVTNQHVSCFWVHRGLINLFASGIEKDQV